MNRSAGPSGTFQWPVMAHKGRTAHLLYILYIKVPGGSVVAVGRRYEKISSLGPNEVGEPARSPALCPIMAHLGRFIILLYILYRNVPFRRTAPATYRPRYRHPITAAASAHLLPSVPIYSRRHVALPGSRAAPGFYQFTIYSI